MKKLKDCFRLLKMIWRLNDEERNTLIELYDKVNDSPNRDFIFECLEPVRTANKVAVIALGSNGDMTYSVNDDNEYDVDFRNACKDIIKEDIFNSIGQEKYQMNLAKFEPDLNVAFTELDYQQARADYNERMVAYLKAVNDPMGMKSPQLSNMWNNIQELDKVLKMAEMRLNDL